ncbi:unnamed protein product [Colias eurytheme]|nr:unnamed protein product [Colias eurytheme]
MYFTKYFLYNIILLCVVLEVATGEDTDEEFFKDIIIFPDTFEMLLKMVSIRSRAFIDVPVKDNCRDIPIAYEALGSPSHWPSAGWLMTTKFRLLDLPVP